MNAARSRSFTIASQGDLTALLANGFDSVVFKPPLCLAGAESGAFYRTTLYAIRPHPVEMPKWLAGWSGDADLLRA